MTLFHSSPRDSIMKTASLALTVAAVTWVLGKPITSSAAGKKPNLVYVLCDDLGYGDIQCLNPKRGKIATPHADQLAREGMAFTDAHSGSSVCTPTRYGILTGRYAWRTRLQGGVMQDNQPPLIAGTRFTVAKLLKQEGYNTACIGKWHLGYWYDDAGKTSQPPRDVKFVPRVGTRILEGPVTRGFDTFYGFHHARSIHVLVENDRVSGKVEPVDMLPHLAKRAVEYIGEEAKSTRPFFLYLALNSPHTPIVPGKEWQDKSGLGKYGDFVMETDWALGEVLKALEKNGLAANTLVIFASDNGPEPSFERQRSGGLRGMKWSLYEGGIREPFLVRWPGHIPAGKTDDTTVLAAIDLFPSLCALAGIALPQGAAIDGLDRSAALLGTPQPRDKPLFWEYGRKPDYLFPREPGARSPNLAVLNGKWKLLVNADATGTELYDLATDPNETENLTLLQPAVANRLQALVLAWRKALP